MNISLDSLHRSNTFAKTYRKFTVLWKATLTQSLIVLSLKDVVSNGILKMLRCPLKGPEKRNKPDMVATMAKHPDSHRQI